MIKCLHCVEVFVSHDQPCESRNIEKHQKSVLKIVLHVVLLFFATMLVVVVVVVVNC